MICSVYRQPRNNDKIIDELKNEINLARKITPLIFIGEDFNAHSVLWSNQFVDNIGEIFFDFIIYNNLTLLNKVSHGPTFMNQNNSSVIDLTLCSIQINQICAKWKCS